MKTEFTEDEYKTIEDIRKIRNYWRHSFHICNITTTEKRDVNRLRIGCIMMS